MEWIKRWPKLVSENAVWKLCNVNKPHREYRGQSHWQAAVHTLSWEEVVNPPLSPPEISWMMHPWIALVLLIGTSWQWGKAWRAESGFIHVIKVLYCGKQGGQLQTAFGNGLWPTRSETRLGKHGKGCWHGLKTHHGLLWRLSSADDWVPLPMPWHSLIY